MKHNIKNYLSYILILGMFGCSKESSNVDFDEGKSSENSVLIRIDDACLTKGELECRVSLRKCMFAHFTGKSITGAGELAALKGRIIDEFIRDELLLNAAGEFAKTNQTLRAEFLDEIREKFLSQKAKGTNTVKTLVGSLAKKDKDTFDRLLEKEVLIEAFLQKSYGNLLNLSDKAVEEGIAGLTEYNKKASLTNEITYALATNIWKKAMGGEDFSKLVNQYSKDPDKYPGGDMGEMTEVDFADEDELWNKLWKMKDGEVTAPIETNMGLEIVKVNAHLSESESNSGDKALRLSRIFLRRAILVDDNYTPEGYRKEMERHYRERILKTLVSDQWNKCKFQCPNGTKDLPRFSWMKVKGFPFGKNVKEPKK